MDQELLFIDCDIFKIGWNVFVAWLYMSLKKNNAERGGLKREWWNKGERLWSSDRKSSSLSALLSCWPVKKDFYPVHLSDFLCLWNLKELSPKQISSLDGKRSTFENSWFSPSYAAVTSKQTNKMYLFHRIFLRTSLSKTTWVHLENV